MWRNTVSKAEIKDLTVKVLEPEKIGDASSDITLPVTFRTRGDLQRWKIIIPNDNTAKTHPAFPVAKGVAKKIIPMHSEFKVNGFANFSAYTIDGQTILAS